MEVQTLFTNDPSGAELVNFARQTAEQLVKNNLTRSQIRSIFTEVRKIESLWDSRPEDALRRLNMLKPKLDYQTARSEPVRLLRDVLTNAIEAVNAAPDAEQRDRRFQRFMDLFEAILAYHRSEGGRN
jgi:CRISPR-associated protein Csm2